MKKLLALLTIVSLAALCESAYSANNSDLWSELIQQNRLTRKACRSVVEIPESRDGCIKQNDLEYNLMKKIQTELFRQLEEAKPDAADPCFGPAALKHIEALTQGINRAYIYGGWIMKMVAADIVAYAEKYASLMDKSVWLRKHCD
jgi:hypothetical protein